MRDPRPVLVVLGGINGAGKSTIASMMASEPRFAQIPFLNPDVETAREVSARPGITAAAAQYLGVRFVLENLQAHIAARTSVIAETVFANQTMLRQMEAAKAAGFKVILYFVGIATVGDSINRVARRVQKGGHDVPEQDIRRRWPKAHDNLARAIPIADEVFIYCNDGYDKPPRLVGHARDGRLLHLDPAPLPAVTAALQPLLG